MVYKYRILPEKELILQYYSENVSLEDLVLALDKVITDPDFVPGYHGLTILTDAEVGISATGVKHYSEWFAKVVNSPVTPGKIAILVDRPSHTALTQIFQFELKNFQDIQVFNTFGGACSWLDMDKAELLEELKQLKKNDPVILASK